MPVPTLLSDRPCRKADLEVRPTEVTQAALLHFVVCGSDSFGELAEAEAIRFVGADDVDLRFVRDLVFHFETPVAGVDQQPPHAFAFQVFGATKRSGEYSSFLARLAGKRLSPSDGHHRIVLLADHRIIVRAHPIQHLSKYHWATVSGQRQIHAVDIRWPPDITILDAVHDRVILHAGSDDSPSALLSVMTVMVDPCFAQDLSSEPAIPTLRSKRVLSKLGLAVDFECMGGPCGIQ